MVVKVEVAYALPEEQVLLELEVGEGASLREVIEASGLLRRFPEIDLAKQQVGVFGVVRGLEEGVRRGDRVEIYRGLVMDPKEARRVRAEKAR